MKHVSGSILMTNVIVGKLNNILLLRLWSQYFLIVWLLLFQLNWLINLKNIVCLSAFSFKFGKTITVIV